MAGNGSPMALVISWLKNRPTPWLTSPAARTLSLAGPPQYFSDLDYRVRKRQWRGGITGPEGPL